jgi:hypothetical protein
MHYSGSKEGDMKTLNEIGVYELKDLLIRNWMTHDGMWFYHCLRELGIEQTNRLNKAAIKSPAEIEIKRAKKIHGPVLHSINNAISRAVRLSPQRRRSVVL